MSTEQTKKKSYEPVYLFTGEDLFSKQEEIDKIA